MKAIIIEDEEIIARVLQNKIKNVAPDIQIVELLPSLKTSRRWLNENAEPDLIFMDIQLGDGVSFDLLKDFELKCPIIFTTAFDEYACRAFRANGIDYLLKPVDETQLATAIEKCRRMTGTHLPAHISLENLLRNLANPAAAIPYKERFIANVRNQWLPINTSDIACFGKDVLNFIYLHNGEKYLIDHNTLDEVESLLNPQQFYRANRQYIVNIDAIKSVKPVENSKLIIKLKEPNHHLVIDMSRLKTADFKKWLNR